VDNQADSAGRLGGTSDRLAAADGLFHPPSVAAELHTTLLLHELGQQRRGARARAELPADCHSGCGRVRQLRCISFTAVLLLDAAAAMRPMHDGVSLDGPLNGLSVGRPKGGSSAAKLPLKASTTRSNVRSLYPLELRR